MNVAGLTRMRWLLGTLLIAAAALFAIGVALKATLPMIGWSRLMV